MRGTVAKRIRKLVQRDFDGHPARTYLTKEHPPRTVVTGALDAQGKQVVKTYTPVQIVLSEGCQRNVSQYIKRHYTNL